jgi:hypothetical protein
MCGSIPSFLSLTSSQDQVVRLAVNATQEENIPIKPPSPIRSKPFKQSDLSRQYTATETTLAPEERCTFIVNCFYRFSLISCIRMKDDSGTVQMLDVIPRDDTGMAEFNDLLNDYLKCASSVRWFRSNTESLVEIVSEEATGGGNPRDDYVWDIFYRRPASQVPYVPTAGSAVGMLFVSFEWSTAFSWHFQQRWISKWYSTGLRFWTWGSWGWGRWGFERYVIFVLGLDKTAHSTNSWRQLQKRLSWWRGLW